MKEPRPRPVHPGEILREDFLPEYALTSGSLAKALHVPRDRIEKLVREKRAITADTAMRLARYFDTKTTQTKTAQQLLRQLQGSNLQIEMPTLADSLNAVRNYKAKP